MRAYHQSVIQIRPYVVCAIIAYHLAMHTTGCVDCRSLSSFEDAVNAVAAR